ncbi:MAG: cytochrome C, partial [Gemmatimonadales bacterium]
ELTAMGRQFKLNGYVFRRGSDSLQGRSPEGQQNMLLGLVTPLSFMLQTSYTATAKAQPGTQNGTVFFPDQVSLFTGGEITPHVGGFLQVTFDPQSGSLGIDNADFRYANHTIAFGEPTIYGVSLNNNPTVQDVWNSTPAWGFPYASSAAAPTPAAATLIDGSLAGQVAGLTAYAMWGSHLYLEAGGYRAAPLGVQRPLALDSSAFGQIQGFAPYWRVALPMQFGDQYLSIGTYGMSANRYPADVTQPLNKFTDVAVDVSFLAPVGHNSFTVDGTWIHESQQRNAGESQNINNTLTTLRFDAMYHIGHEWAFTVAPFSTTGTADNVLYAPGAMNGSANGKPDNSGVIGEVDFMPWQNIRLQAQYVAYSKFNGGSTNYDGSGRNAADNNTLYLITWLLF